jgi:hypothetical protein
MRYQGSPAGEPFAFCTPFGETNSGILGVRLARP